MTSIPIFDSLTHPMPNANWLNPKYEGRNSIKRLLAEMVENNVQWALAVGMGPSIGGYHESSYASFIREHSDQLLPVAFMDFNIWDRGVPVIDYLRRLKSLGYVGIKIHPRISNICFSNGNLPELIKEANKLNLVVLLCTYFWSSEKNLSSNTPENLLSLLCEVPDEKIVLLHGGTVRLFEVMEIARQFPKAILDLSFTLCKYEGSSIDLDIQYIFENFDRRICIGSDSPEFSLFKLRERFEYLARDLGTEKKENIGFRNLKSYIGLGI